VKVEFREIVRLLDRLHRPKDAAYGDAWRKRGEVLGIFCNIARKHDRLTLAMGEIGTIESTESLSDTIADLAIYAGKYLTWLAEMFPEEFDAVSPGLTSASCEDRAGPDALVRVFEGLDLWAGAADVVPPSTIPEAVHGLQSAFSSLEDLLVTQAEGVEGNPVSKVELAWALTYESVWLLVRLSEDYPAHLRNLEESVGQMERT
jgi:hypothetical protein